MAMIANIDFGTSNDGEKILGGARTLLGVAEFREAEKPSVDNFAAPMPVDQDDWEHIEPPREPMILLAPMICNVVFASDEQADVISEQDFAAFVFHNPVRLFAGMNPDFFNGTAVEADVARALANDAASN